MTDFVPELTAGSTLDFVTLVEGYPPSDGYQLVYRLVPMPGYAANATTIAITAGPEGDRYRVQVPLTTTANWIPGLYSWFANVEKYGFDKPVDDGIVTILPHPSNLAPGYDSRTQAAKAVDDIKAAMATFTASGGLIKEYEIAGRRTVYEDKAAIITHLQFWQRQLDDERINDRLAKGQPNPRQVKTRFIRA